MEQLETKRQHESTTYLSALPLSATWDVEKKNDIQVQRTSLWG